MHSFSAHPPVSTQALQVARHDCWSVYNRLLDLSVPVWRSADGQVFAGIRSVADAVQVYSVVRQFQASRQVLAEGLERCWEQACDRSE